MNNELIKQIDEERYAYRLYGFDGSSTDLVLADCKAEIERLSKPYVPISEHEIDTLWRSVEYTKPYDEFRIDLAQRIETAVIARYNEQRGVK